MGTIDTEYWKKYYDFWDDLVRRWYESGANPKDPITMGYQKCVNALDLNELPEPYYGTPHRGVAAVFVNLNPGGSAGVLDATKFYSNRKDADHGWLIRKFIDAQSSYRKFIDAWSSLNYNLRDHVPEVCGVKWWQGLAPNPIGGRMSWVRQVYDDWNMCPSNVFALEMCPFHSKEFKFHLARSNELKSFFTEHLFVPMITATCENRLPFAIAIGAPIKNVIQKQLGLMPEKEWYCNLQRQLSDETIKDVWPHSDDGKFSVRWYQLYCGCINEKKARILVTWTRSASNPHPKCGKEGFLDVEQRIRQYVKDNPID